MTGALRGNGNFEETMRGKARVVAPSEKPENWLRAYFERKGWKAVRVG